MSTKGPKAGVGSTEAADEAGRELDGYSDEEFARFLEGELDGSSEPSSSDEFARRLEIELDGSSEPSSNEEFARFLERELDGSSVPSGSEESARLPEIDSESTKKLLSHNKLYLVIDLDYTVLNSTDLDQMTAGEEYLRSETDSLQDVFTVDVVNTMTKLRPFSRTFLREASKLYEMYIYTTGKRPYALEMAKLLDPSREYFGDRVISLDDGTTEEHGLDSVLGQDTAFVILDDTGSAWTNHKDNLILVERYEFFKSSCPQFGINRTSLSESKSDESDSKGALATVLEALKQIHTMFFHVLEGNLLDRDVKEAMKTLKKEVVKGQQTIVFSAFFASDVHNAWKMMENFEACYGVREGAKTFVMNLFSLLTKSSRDEDIRRVISWEEDNASFTIHSFPAFHDLVGRLHGQTRDYWLYSLHDYGFVREGRRTFRHQEGQFQREQPELVSEIAFTGQRMNRQKA